MKRQRVYWLIPHKTQKHISIINALERRSFLIQSVTDFHELLTAFEEQRAAIVIVDEHQTTKDLAMELKTIAHLPIFYGVRLIFSFLEPNHNLIRFLGKLGFRDALPIDLSIERWIERFIFSTSSGEGRIFKQPLPQMTLENIAAISIPARITYIDTKYLRVESRIRLKENQKIRLTGKFASELGIKSLTLTVLNRYETNVHFRYSDGYIMSWHAPNADVNKVNVLFNSLLKQAIDDPIRVFSAIHTAELRKSLVASLPYPHFELAIALHKRSLLQEPRYFDPDVIVIEAQLMDPNKNHALNEMLDFVSLETPIYILGQNPDKESLEKFGRATNRKFHYIESVPTNFASSLNRKIQAKSDMDKKDSGYHISHNHRFSYGELRFPARLTRIHPEVAQFASPFQVGSYALCTIESPLLKQTLNRGLIAKVTNTYKHDNQDLASFPQLIDCSFCDTSKADRKLLAEQIISIFRDNLNQTDDASLYEVADTDLLGGDGLEAESPDDTKQDELAVPEIKIEKSASIYASYHNSFWVKYGRELQVVFAVLVLMGILYLAITVLRKPPTEQGKVFSDSIQKYYEKVNPNRSRSPEEP